MLTSKNNFSRNAKIISLIGKKSQGLIAKQMGLKVNIVAGVIWRHKNPPEKRIHNGNGRGYHGGVPSSKYAQETLNDY